MSKVVDSCSSFQKANVKRPVVQGTRVSLRNAQLLVSSGVSSLDNFVGGGLPVGTLCCIEEDSWGVYSKLILKHFVAEGVLNGHHIFLASQGAEAEGMVESLPCPVADGGAISKGNQSSDQMKIAWRYENINSNEPDTSYSVFGHIYDTSKVMDSEKLESANIKYWKCSENFNNKTQSSLSVPYLDLLNSIRQEIESVGCKVDSAKDKKNVVRIALCSLASPLWSNQTGSKVDYGELESEFLTFIYFLKALLRNSYAVCMLTVPAHLFQETSTLCRLRNVVDIGIVVESFADSEEVINEVYREYRGLFRFSKLFAINTMVPHSSESLDLAFKLKRKRLIIEKLCLAPELLGQGDKANAQGMGCGSNLLQLSAKDGKGGCGSIDF